MRNTWQQALLWLIACDTLQVSACDAPLASYMQRTPSCRGPAPLPLQWLSNRKCNFCSLNFAWSTCARVRQAEHWQQESWKLREQWYRYYFEYETQCCLGHLGQGAASEKEMSSIEVGSCGSERQHVTLFVWSFCLKQSHHCCSCWTTATQGDVTRRVVYSEEAQFTRRIFDVFIYIMYNYIIL